jgi:hypothetical protein
MARFRLFGRTPEPAPAEAAGESPPPAPGAAWGAAAWPPAAPAAWAAPPGPRIAADPPTDPRGFPAVPPLPAPRQAWRPSPCPNPDPAEAAALAGAFAVDYLSWDEEDPARRGRVLHDYLAVPGGDLSRIGWSGKGRQRADFALPGRVRHDGEGRVLVDVRVRVTPYRAVGEHDGRAGREPDRAPVGVPAVAPAPTGRGWRSLPSCWVRLSVPVVWEGGRLAVDAWEETLGEDAPPPPSPPGTGGRDHALAEDDPLAELPGGAR